LRKDFAPHNRLMPELPDIELYLHALRPRTAGMRLEKVRLFSPFVLRSVAPPIREAEGRKVVGLERVGKRIVLALEEDLFLMIHLMIAGRLRWSDKVQDTRPSGKVALARFDFEIGQLTLTEVASHKRASLVLARGREALQALDPGGIGVFDASTEAFADRLRAENRTLKRALANPRAFDGIGNAYSDEILHAARLSPLRLTRSLDAGEVERLLGACRKVLAEWTDRLLAEFGERFPGPGDVTAFRSDFAVHGKYGQPCPVCGSPVQRIRYAENETNYCAHCQNEGRMLADRSLSRLLKDDWPKTIEQMVGE
jgi:formamidopyrimidine-DNA glycosylase